MDLWDSEVDLFGEDQQAAAPAAAILEESDEELDVPEAEALSLRRDAEEEEDASNKLWKRVEKVLREYSLSRLGMAASRKWIMMMGDPKNEELARLRALVGEPAEGVPKV